jgi:hypothetical protein
LPISRCAETRTKRSGNRCPRRAPGRDPYSPRFSRSRYAPELAT